MDLFRSIAEIHLSEPQSRILRQQNDPTMHALLRAMSVSHSRAQRLGAIRTGLSAAIAGSSLVGTFLDLAIPITVIGALWAVIYSLGLVSWADGEQRRAAILQEMFDVRLFGLPWNKVIASEQVGMQEINRLSKRYRGKEDMIQDYYEVHDLPHPYDALGCQLQNLGWGARIRKRYAHTVFAGIVIWSALGILVGVLTDLTVSQLVLRWYIPSLGIFLIGIDVFRSQRGVALERERTFNIVRERVAAAANESHSVDEKLKVLARQVQDIIFLTRIRATRVPNWYFLRFRLSDRGDFRAVMDELQTVVALRG